jgi:hypothetical protein
MSLYLRKSFRAGPIRFNLSKGGLGLSGGVKGARIGVSPRGPYVHAGRQGLYYRKHLSSGRSRSKSNAGSEGCATLLLVVIAIGLGVWLLSWLIEHLLVLVIGIILALGILVLRWSIRFRRGNLLSAYKKALDATFVTAQSPPNTAALSALKQQQQRLPKNDAIRKQVEQIEADVYQAVLDKVLDDSLITKEEATIISAAEQTLKLSPAARLQVKKDIFSAAYVEAIQDREITKDELNILNNLITGLGIPQEEVQSELDIVQEIIKAQALSLPFEPILSDELLVQKQKSEDAFYQCSAQLLSKRKSRTSPTGYEYTVKRDGTMVVTNKRVFVVGEGTTSIYYFEIADLDVDIDEGIIEISKATSSRPVVFKTAEPIYTSRTIDLLMKGQTDKVAA